MILLMLLVFQKNILCLVKIVLFGPIYLIYLLISTIGKKCRENRRQHGLASPSDLKRTSRQFSEEGVVIDFYRNLGLDPVIKK